MKILMPVLYVLIPWICVVGVGIYFGYLQLTDGLKTGMDDSDAYQWAIMAGMFYCPIGLIPGLIVDLFIWLITNEPKTKTVS